MEAASQFKSERNSISETPEKFESWGLVEVMGHQRYAGLITEQPVGENGFGFDPVMYIPEFGQTFAQLPPEVKNAHSHRGRAAQQMLQLMRANWLPEGAA